MAKSGNTHRSQRGDSIAKARQQARGRKEGREVARHSRRIQKPQVRKSEPSQVLHPSQRLPSSPFQQLPSSPPPSLGNENLRSRSARNLKPFTYESSYGYTQKAQVVYDTPWKSSEDEEAQFGRSSSIVALGLKTDWLWNWKDSYWLLESYDHTRFWSNRATRLLGHRPFRVLKGMENEIYILIDELLSLSWYPQTMGHHKRRWLEGVIRAKLIKYNALFELEMQRHAYCPYHIYCTRCNGHWYRLLDRDVRSHCCPKSGAVLLANIKNFFWPHVEIPHRLEHLPSKEHGYGERKYRLHVAQNDGGIGSLTGHCRRKKTAPGIRTHVPDNVLDSRDVQSTDILETFQTITDVDTRGNAQLSVWKRTAGANKSWRRCPKFTTTLRRRPQQMLARMMIPLGEFSRSPLWLPSAFTRRPRGESLPLLKRAVRYREPKSRREIEMFENSLGSYIEDDATSRTRGITGSDSISQVASQNLVYDTTGRSIVEPRKLFIRLVWEDGMIMNSFEQVERFLPHGFVFRSGWRVDQFIRNDSHADVYSLTPSSLAGPSVSAEAHVFLECHHGNSDNYAKRHKRRMRKSGNVLDTFWCDKKHIMIVRVPKPEVHFRLKNTEDEFPSLSDRGKWRALAALQRRSFQAKPSYAAVVGWKPQASSTASRPTQGLLEKAAMEKELERIEKKRLKKKEKQRSKRQAARSAKTFANVIADFEWGNFEVGW